MKNNQTSSAEGTNTILDDLHALVAKAEELISKSFKSEPGIASTVKENLKDTQSQIIDCLADTKKKVVTGVQCTDKAIHSHPYQSLALATGVGVLIGIIADHYISSKK